MDTTFVASRILSTQTLRFSYTKGTALEQRPVKDGSSHRNSRAAGGAWRRAFGEGGASIVATLGSFGQGASAAPVADRLESANASFAQQPTTTMHRIEFFGPTSAAAIASRLAAFRAGMNDFGYAGGVLAGGVILFRNDRDLRHG